jgi:MFS transporter, ACS family, D-galactonate transporter
LTLRDPARANQGGMRFVATLPSHNADKRHGARVATNSDAVEGSREIPATTSSAATVPKGLIAAVALLGFSVFINYIDRGNLAIAAPLLKDELGLSPKQLGTLLSSIFWTYAGCQILSGWLVDRFSVNWVLAGGFLLWSTATAETGFAQGFAALLLLRLVLGAGESVAFPSYSKILAQHCPERLRGRANAFISSGIAAGPAFGIFFGARLVARYGWRPFFIGLGLLSLAWIVPWLKWMPRGPGMTLTGRAKPPSFLQILEQRSAWGTFAGLFAYNYLSYFLLTWLPYYLVHEHNFSMEGMGNVGGAAYGILAASAMICGWAADFWIVRGGSLTRVRKTFTALGLAVASLSCMGVELFASDPRVAISFLFLTCVGAGLCTSNLWAITQTLAGPEASGKWTGVQNFVGNFAGVVSPWLTGLVVDKTGHFFWAFAALALVLISGAASWAFVVGRVEPIQWNAAEDATNRPAAAV